MGRSNVVSVEPGKEDIRDEFPELLSCKSDHTRRLFLSSCLIVRELPRLKDIENQRQWSGR